MRSLLLILALVAGPLAGRGQAAPAQVADPGTAQLSALRAELQKAESAVLPLQAKKTQLEGDAQVLATSIDAQKRKPEGVTRDAELQALLTRSKTKTDEIERAQAELRWRLPGLAELRRRMIRAIDQVLDGKSVAEAPRLELERLRTAQVALLVSPSLPIAIARDSKVVVDPLDGPRELGEKADLLRDSGDKLRREVKRLATRIDGVDRRRRLRERAGSLDEDMFGESTSSRRIARAGDGSATPTLGTATTVSGKTSDTAAGGAAIAPANTASGTPTQSGSLTGGATVSAPTGARSDTTVLRNLVDPATLDELRQSDGIDDADRQMRALKRAQTELETLAGELDRRANALDGRAKELKQKK